MMSEGINYTVVYEDVDGVEEIDTVRWFKEKDNFTEIQWYPDAEGWEDESQLVNREERKTHIPTERIIRIDEQ